MAEKRCTKCGVLKKIEEFYLDKTHKNGYHSHCKKCVNANTRIRNKRRKQKYNGLYTVWDSMKRRCANPERKHYKWYGARGITVCKGWRTDFLIFYNWAITHGHKKGLQIDRKDNNGNYCPKNCRFVTQKENGRNRPNPIAKLNIEKVNKIKGLLKEGKLLHREIGAIFNVSPTNISSIKRGKSWRN